MKKSYKPSGSREKSPLTVEQQRQLVAKAEGKTKALLILILSTGMHPKILSKNAYKLEWGPNYYTFLRTKTFKRLHGSWSPAMKERHGILIEGVYRIKNRTPQRYWQLLKELGRECKISGLCPLQCRKTYFVNRARQGVNAYDIAQAAQTSMSTIYHHYMKGSTERKRLSEDDKEWLDWLMGD